MLLYFSVCFLFLFAKIKIGSLSDLLLRIPSLSLAIVYFYLPLRCSVPSIANVSSLSANGLAKDTYNNFRCHRFPLWLCRRCRKLLFNKLMLNKL